MVVCLLFLGCFIDVSIGDTSTVQNTVPITKADKFGNVVHIELLHDVGSVGVNCFMTYEQFVGNCFIAVAIAQEPDYFVFALT